jgi:methionyl-tRNA formyltransferase
MRVAFAGSHEISWFCLRAIAELCRKHGDELVGVFNHPPDVGARHSAFITFDQLEAEFRFPHFRVESLSSPESLRLLRELRLDVLFVIGWHRIVPQEVIDAARYTLGVHASLLPRNRGSSPINWSIIRQERVGGLSYFHLSAGIDSGDLIDQIPWAIGPADDCRDIYDKAAIAAVELIRRHWPRVKAGSLDRHPQEERLATVNPRRRPVDGQIDWSRPAEEVDALVRGITHPYPGAFTHLRGKKLLIWECAVEPDDPAAASGVLEVRTDSLRVSTGRGCLQLKRLQFDGEPECSAPVFAAVYGIRQGESVMSADESEGRPETARAGG